MEKILTAAQMGRAEELTEKAGTSTAQLMQNAGAAAARVIAEALARGGPEARVLILCGPGNNGGDGLVAAERLSERGYAVAAYTFRRQEPVPARPLVIRHEDDTDLVALRRLVEGSTVIVDALLGTGRLRPIAGPLAAILDAVRNATPPRVVVALDLPSGVDADTGAADPHTLPATITITMGFLKRGLLLGRGVELAGHVVTADIGMAPEAAMDVPLWRVAEEDVRARIPTRPHDVNKYSAGAVLVVAGSRRFTGAPQLAALGAARAGAGLVTLATGASTHPILAAHLLEPTFLVLEDDAHGVLDPAPAVEEIRQAAARYRALLIGPGLAHAENTVRLVEMLVCEDGLPEGLPVVLDAEGLNALARIDRWPERKRYPLVLTPHGGEMARLCDGEGKEIEARRFDVAPEKARAWGVVVVLKGHPTVTAAPDGSAAVNATGGPNLASGGTGDVLGGMIAALIAQGATPFDAAVAGVYLHGRAGDDLAERYGDRGTLAGDLVPVIPTVIKRVVSSQ
jgi:NAD(P)H-hydrate epimerase